MRLYTYWHKQILLAEYRRGRARQKTVKASKETKSNEELAYSGRVSPATLRAIVSTWNSG